MANKARVEIVQALCRKRLETTRWSQGVALRGRIIEGARPAQLRAGARRYRIYFNRLNEAPQVWSLDEGSQASEINVAEIRLIGVVAETRVALDETVNRDRPKAWIEVVGTLSVVNGVAMIFGKEGQHG